MSESDANHAVGSVLPHHEDALLAGVKDGFDLGWEANLVDDLGECDIFATKEFCDTLWFILGNPNCINQMVYTQQIAMKMRHRTSIER